MINIYIREMRNHQIGNDFSDSELIRLFENALEATNPKFSTGKFEEACLDGIPSRISEEEKKDIEDLMKAKRAWMKENHPEVKEESVKYHVTEMTEEKFSK